MRNVKIKIIDKRIAAAMPAYGSKGAAGLDLRACIESEMVLNPGEVKLIPTGFAMHLADEGLAAMIMPRSGLGHKNGIVLGNLVGLIDSDYQGELKVSLWNRSLEAFVIKPMDRIAQLVVVPVIQVGFDVVDDFEEASARGNGGFNSTGTH